MNVRSRFAGAVALSALVLVAASPASARGYNGHWGRYHHRGHDNSGAVIGAIIGVGILAAIATSAAKSRDERRVRTDGYDPRYDNRGYEGGSYGYDNGATSGAYSDGASYADEDVAVDACAIAARDEASRNGGFAEVRDITGARQFGNGWDVTGTVSERAGFRAADSRVRSFRCIWDDGRVEGVSFG